jgi:hypothetical protein
MELRPANEDIMKRIAIAIILLASTGCAAQPSRDAHVPTYRYEPDGVTFEFDASAHKLRQVDMKNPQLRHTLSYDERKAMLAQP